MYRTTEDIKQLITEAYDRLATRGDWVKLVRIRDAVGDVCRWDVDAALRQMDRLPHVNLIPDANQKTLTDLDRELAVEIGGQPNHLIAIW